MSKTSIIRADGVRDSTEQRAADNYAATLAKNLFDAEAAARVAADNALQGNIDAEAAARVAADNALQGNIDAEAAARATADSGLQSNIDAETAARMQADSGLQGNINTEATERIQADSELQENINAVAEAFPKFATAQEIEEAWGKPAPPPPTPMVTLNAEYAENIQTLFVSESEFEQLQEIPVGSEFDLRVNVDIGVSDGDAVAPVSFNAITAAEVDNSPTYELTHSVHLYDGEYTYNSYRCIKISHYDSPDIGEIQVISY